MAPEGWRQLEAVFAMTVVAGVSEVLYSDDDERVLRVQPPDHVHELVSEHRDLSAGFEGGPWWRLLVRLDRDGRLETDYDFGEEPFPDGQLFPPEAYQADLRAYPRERIPVWLGAYAGHGDRQSRPPAVAARQARADRSVGVGPEVSDDDFPDLPTLWRRWAVMAAAFVAAGSPWGPRIRPALAWFEGSRRSGSTLCVLPGNRAVLSGGVWDAPALEAAYNGGSALPDLYAGAPEWVTDPVLNTRYSQGMLSFCYWWDNDRWYRADSPPAEQLSAAVPGIWTADTVAQVVLGLIGADSAEGSASGAEGELRSAVDTLVAAAAADVVTRDTLVAVFGDDDTFDIDSAFNQLTMAGVTVTGPAPLPRAEAIERVRTHILEQDIDAGEYPLEQLRADRISVGWLVYVPTEPDEISIGRALFYVADDGVLEQSSSSIAPSRYLAGFEQRYRERTGAVETV
ncbi:MAG: hypothetical protein J2P18_12395 [Nocardia sp.]|nr:hypothetical protein [Nocardia sp.]